MDKFKEEVDKLNSDDKFVRFLSDEKETELLINTYRDEGYEKGIEAGIEQGKLVGIENGELQERKKIAKEMINKGIDINLISELTKLSIDKIEELKKHNT